MAYGYLEEAARCLSQAFFHILVVPSHDALTILSPFGRTATSPICCSITGNQLEVKKTTK